MLIVFISFSIFSGAEPESPVASTKACYRSTHLSSLLDNCPNCPIWTEHSASSQVRSSTLGDSRSETLYSVGQTADWLKGYLAPVPVRQSLSNNSALAVKNMISALLL